MKKRHFYIVDVFAEQKYSGNQLAVFLADDSLSAELMQTIARETNFAETTFILSDEPKNGGFDVRIFTPGEEMPFAGHPTLGTAFVIRNEILRDSTENVILNLKVGQIPVTFGAEDILWMKQNQPEFGPEFEPGPLAAVLNLDENELDDRFPVQGVSTGLPFVIVPVKSLQGLKEARLSQPHYEEFVKDPWTKAILFFCPEGYEENQDVSVRMFAPVFGIVEDAATGSGNGCLAAYLVKHRYFGTDSIDVRSAQGYEINRPSTLYLKAAQNDQGIAVSVGGKVVKIAEGDFV
jgi:trans-2,3-dihydro-3-hydroxyanthranilate isomerase